MKTDYIGLYVHVPFCVKKCNYCDFCSFSGVADDTRRSYIEKLCKEIRSYKKKNVKIDTVFFGGGTPTLLTKEDFEKILSSIKESFYLHPDVEITVEANPGTADYEKLKELVSLGVNRFSVGLQSIHENELKSLGRIHSYEDFLIMYFNLRKLGINNVNVDLMYGIPEQTIATFSQTLKEITNLHPEHLSVYGLILEEGTPFYEKKGSLPLPDEDLECDMYDLACKYLSKMGYTHYEISNYAIPGYTSRHNLKYWRCKEYIGVGVSAYSYFEGVRFGNVKNLTEYINNENLVLQNDVIDEDSNKYEYAMLALRLSEGISLADYTEKFAEDFLEGREDIISKLSSGGYISIIDGRLALTEKGFYISNYIITELL